MEELTLTKLLEIKEILEKEDCKVPRITIDGEEFILWKNSRKKKLRITD